MQAPGKLVFSGDYIALLGAPALVFAVNRLASATLTQKDRGGWSVVSNVAEPVRFQNFESVKDLEHHRHLAVLLDALTDTSVLPQHAELNLDTAPFYQNGQKLGIGSSAALLVALAELLGVLAKHRYATPDLIEFHNLIQTSNGSGLDIVAARIGGLTRFQNGAAKRIDPPQGLQMRFVFTGISTETGPMLSRFHQIVSDPQENVDLDPWQHLATTAANATTQLTQFLACMAELDQFVYEFDQKTKLGIYSTPHQTALNVATDIGVHYKPCGAGGGDTGVAFGDDPDALNVFEERISRKGLTVLNMEVANHGPVIQL